MISAPSPFPVGAGLMGAGVAWTLAAGVHTGGDWAGPAALLVSAVILLAIAWSGRGRWGRAPQRMLTVIALAGLVSGALAAIIAALFGGVSFAGLGLIFGGVVALGGLIVPAMRTPV